MLTFHKKDIALQKHLSNQTDNFIQVSACIKAFKLLEDIKLFSIIFELKNNELISFVRLLDNAEQVSALYTLYELKRRRGRIFRTTVAELSSLSKVSPKIVEYILILLEEIKIISMSNTAIIEIRYLHEELR
ncbi:hypothetical protein [Halobacteriovorax sp. HLS]|uniref:hypothetical protein n=1 Tax=Halobacteriovorax sp. HLS TaxID=2234000 RepID=UPI000FD989E4|nr:hypothetical protein [Halobacteriovorax sp. HLS]